MARRRAPPTRAFSCLQSYGAFIDIGAASDGLAHVSQLSSAFVKEPKDVLKLGQEVEVRVLSVDADKGRFALTLRSEDEEAPRARDEGDAARRPQRRGKVARAAGGKERKQATVNVKVGEELTGKVARVMPYGVFVTVNEDGVEGLLHESEVKTDEIQPNLRNMFAEGQEVQVRVLGLEKGKVSLTQKTDEERRPFQGASAEIDPSSVKTTLEYEIARAGLNPGMFPKV